MKRYRYILRKWKILLYLHLLKMKLYAYHQGHKSNKMALVFRYAILYSIPDRYL